MNKVHDIQGRPGAIWSCVAEGAIMTDETSDSDQRGVARADLQDVQLMDALRALWRDCIEKVRRRATPEEWAPVETRLAELDRQLVPGFGPRQPN
jgi:hypothetical protein